MTKRICVIDGQGGGIGATLIKYLKSAYGESIELIALGTNAIATASMLKAGANRGASGENAICRSVLQADAKEANSMRLFVPLKKTCLLRSSDWVMYVPVR